MQADVWEIQRAISGGLELQATKCVVAEPGPGEVLVAIRAISLNFRDLLQIDGRYNARQPLPLIPCSDAAGEVVAVGPGVVSLQVGDRVVNHGLPGWFDGPYRKAKIGVMYGGPDQGTLTTHRTFPADTLLPIPRHLDFGEAATLNCAALTAWSAVMTHGRATAGETFVVQGTGGVSIFALQFASMANARIIATSSSADKLDRVKALGAHHGINYRDGDWSKQVRALTGGEGADAIVEVAGTINESVRAVRSGGTVLCVGVLDGAQPTVDLPQILMRSICMQGITLGSLAEMQAMLTAIEHVGMRPIIDRRFTFDQTEEAFAYYRSAQMFGKVVIEIE